MGYVLDVFPDLGCFLDVLPDLGYAFTVFLDFLVGRDVSASVGTAVGGLLCGLVVERTEGALLRDFAGCLLGLEVDEVL